MEVGRPIQRQVLDAPLGFAHSLNQGVREENDSWTSHLSGLMVVLLTEMWKMGSGQLCCEHGKLKFLLDIQVEMFIRQLDKRN